MKQFLLAALVFALVPGMAWAAESDKNGSGRNSSCSTDSTESDAGNFVWVEVDNNKEPVVLPPEKRSFFRFTDKDGNLCGSNGTAPNSLETGLSENRSSKTQTPASPDPNNPLSLCSDSSDDEDNNLEKTSSRFEIFKRKQSKISESDK
jgi:hypothetical protein